MEILVEYLSRVLAHSGSSLKDQLPGEDKTLGEALIAPTVIYVKQVKLYRSLHYYIHNVSRSIDFGKSSFILILLFFLSISYLK